MKRRDLKTATDISNARLGLMTWAANLERRETEDDPDFQDGGFFYHWRYSYRKQADQITARAVELGLETPAA